MNLTNIFSELSDINTSFDNNDFSQFDKLNFITNEVQKSLNISYILQLKNYIKNNDNNIDNFNHIIDWIINNLHIDYISLFSNTIENIVVTGIIKEKLYNCYENLIDKFDNDDKIIVKYLIFLMKNNDLLKIHSVLNTSKNYKVKYLGDLCFNLLSLLTLDNHSDIWNIPNNQIKNLLISLENEKNLILDKEFLHFQITHMFKIYFEANTTEFCINNAKIILLFLPYLSYTSQHIYEYKYILNKKLKIGFISLYFHNYHSVFTCFSGNLLVTPNNLDIYTFFIGNPDSQITTKFSQNVTNPIFITNQNNLTDIEAIRNTIASFNLDILVYPEIGECALIYYTAFSRLAPIQITTIGHCDTSGISNIDYYISSKLFEDHYNQTYYSEKLILLDNLITYSIPIYINNTYNPNNLTGWFNDNTEFKSRETLCNLFNIPFNSIILHCIQTEYKFSLRFFRVIHHILNYNPNAIILIKKPHSIYANKYEKLIDEYIPKNQYRYISWNQQFDYFNLIHISDIVLMPFPFGGYCTALDVLLMGKPTVTLKGKKLMGSFTSGFYKYMNVTDLIAYSDYQYIDITNQLCQNIEFRINISKKIINNSYKLFYSKESVEEFYNSLQQLYNNHL